MKSSKLPKRIYVKREGEPGERYLEAQETSQGFEDGDKVGIYELIEVKTMKITEELV